MTNAFTTLWEYAFIMQDCSWNPPVEQLMSLSANQHKDNCAAWTNTLRKTCSWVCLHKHCKTCCFSCRQLLKTPWIDEEFSYSVDIFLLKQEVGAELKVIKPKAFILYHILFKPCLKWCPQVGVLILMLKTKRSGNSFIPKAIGMLNLERKDMGMCPSCLSVLM